MLDISASTLTGIKTFTLPSFTLTPSDCGATYTPSLVYKVNGAVATMPAFIQWEIASPTVLTINTDDATIVAGVYSLELVATADTTATVIGGFQKIVAFDLIM